MKEILIIIFSLFSLIEFYAQSEENENCSDIDRYEIKSNISYFPELNIKMNGEWKTFELIDERAELFDYESEELELNGKGSKELIIRWSNSVYGTGGGRTTKGIQIWNLDSGTRILNEITSCSDENFGRNEVSSYYIECQKRIQIDNQIIKVFVKECKSERSNTDNIPDLNSICRLTELKNGEYFFINDKLKLK